MAARKSALWRQTYTLATKNFTILYVHHLVSTIYTAILLPVILTIYLGVGKNLNNPQSEYGIAETRPIRSLEDGLRAADSSRDKVVFVNSGFTGGNIGRAIESLSADVTTAGRKVTVVERAAELGLVCRSSYRGSSSCFGAVVFNSSPDEGEGGIWNYTLRGDRAFGANFEYKKDDNDAQLHILPLQLAVDSVIVRLSSTSADAPDLGNTKEYPFTDQTEEERDAETRRTYQKTFVDYLGVTFILALIGTAYRMPGQMATERELGLSQLIDAMMPTKYDWEAQFARILSYLYSYVSIYFPGWIAASIIASSLIWKETSPAIIIVFFVLGGLALTSQALMGGTPFKKAQLSGIANSLVYVLLGVLAQVLPNPSTGVVAVLSLLFTPCNFVFFIRYIARFESQGQPMDLTKTPPGSNSTLPGFVLWVFLGIQFFVYPVIAAILERAIHSVSADSRIMYKGGDMGEKPQDAVHIAGLTKIYRPSYFRQIFSFISKPRPATIAVNNLTLTVKRGQILALLGSNGSGKSTCLDAIAGLHRFDHGSVSIDASGGIGIAPQKNVLWDDLTVMDHVKIFNELKSPFAKATKQEIDELIQAVGLQQKRKAQVKNLSGGQKRKLQLGLMLTGGSTVCCVDEVSSGVDPLSRRKIWDILLSQRNKRSIILTTHFLDEADLLADNIAILSQGELRAEGSSVALKNTLGAGYSVHVLNAKNVCDPPNFIGVSRKITSTNIIYTAPSSHIAAEVIKALERRGLEYRLSSPTIEDVFLQVAEEPKVDANMKPDKNPGHITAISDETGPEISDTILVKSVKGSPQLLTGRPISLLTQTAILCNKRFTLFKTNWIPYIVPLLVPIVAAAITQLLVKDARPISCTPLDLSAVDADNYGDLVNDARLAAGPVTAFRDFNLDDFGNILPIGRDGLSNAQNISIEYSSSFNDWQAYINENSKVVSPGGWWLGDQSEAPTVAYRADNGTVRSAVASQNLLNKMRTNIDIATSYLPFASPVPVATGQALQLGIYFCLAVGIASAFFGLYPNLERHMNVRDLQYSSGVRSLSQWMSHLAVDFTIFVMPMIVAAIIFFVSSDIWYNPGYLFPVFVLYALCSILVSYTFSLFMHSQLATFAAIMAYNAVGFAIYLIAFLFMLSFSPVTAVDRNILIGHYTISLFFPSGSLLRAFFVSLNVYATACDGNQLYSYPGAINAFGAPILYLSVQATILFLVLLYNDSGNKLPSFLQQKRAVPTEAAYEDQEAAEELLRVDAATDDGLQVKHLTKSFGKYTAVNNVTFGVPHGEVFALVGPNGAGKSTCMSLIRGDIQPDRNGGGAFVEKISVSAQRAVARGNLGVCPQFDAIDNMTVIEHLRHYARIRGVSDVEHQVQAVIQAVGLEAFQNTMAPHLSGGNKRKLSLGIALTGNPSVIILDEPSSGLDAAAKRIMWRTLESLTTGRSMLLTTHSMEEADALASRAGILAQRMLAVGEVETLRKRFGDSLYVHLVSRTAPHSTSEEMDHMRQWVMGKFPRAEIEPETYHGQLRFSVPASAVLGRNRTGGHSEGSAIGQLIVMLEDNKENLGIEHHSVSPTTLNDVFLSIVGQHNVQEEGYNQAGEEKKTGWEKARKLLIGF